MSKVKTLKHYRKSRSKPDWYPITFGFDVIHGYKTISPIPLAEASWDLVAIKKSAAIAAEEAAVGLDFAPMVDVARDARWGRVMEGAGEDPFRK
jgi:beta-glucosidase